MNQDLKAANDAYRIGDYDRALKIYNDCKRKYPFISEAIDLTLKAVERRRQRDEHLYRGVPTKKIIIYSCNFGGYESVKEPQFIEPGIEYYLFTDNPRLMGGGWSVVYIPDRLRNPRRTSRMPKILFHRYLPPHDISVYIDGSLELKTRYVRKMIDECLEGNEIALYRHYKRDCVYEEIDYVQNKSDRLLENPRLCSDIIQKYKSIGHKKNAGLFENAFIVRKNTQQIRDLCDLWWEEYMAGPERDQFSLMYALSVKGIRPNAINNGKQFRDNDYVSFSKHKYRLSRRRERLKPLRIAMVTFGFWPQQAGMEMMIHNLATTLTAMGMEVYLYAPNPSKRYTEIKHNYRLHRFTDVCRLKTSIVEEHFREPFDVLFTQGAHEPCDIALEVRSMTGIPVALRTHGEDIQRHDEIGYGYTLDPTKEEQIKRNIREVDYNIAIGPHVYNSVVDILGSSDRAGLIFNGIDEDFFRPQSKNDYFLKRLGISAKTKVLLAVGRNVKKKSFHLAVEALMHIKKEYHDVILVHIGKKGNGKDLLEAAAELGVEDSFFELGEVSYFELPYAYSSADIFVFPSMLETFGNVTLEAMACGLPCVEFDYVVNQHKILDGKTGYLVSYPNVRELSSRILLLLRDDTLRAQFSEAAVIKAKDFSWQTIGRKYYNVFLRLAETTGTPHQELRQLESLLTEKGHSRIALDKIKQLHDAHIEDQNIYSLHIRARCLWLMAWWHCNASTPDSFKTASIYLSHLATQATRTEVIKKSRVSVLLSEAQMALGQNESAVQTLNSALERDHDPDLMLAMANTNTDSVAKIFWINKALQKFNLPKISFGNVGKQTPIAPYDCLECHEAIDCRIKPEDQELISVIMPAFNSEGTILTSLKSLSRQTWSNIEVIVVDDASQDSTCELVNDYISSGDKRVTLVRNKLNSGPYICRNIGINHAKGKFITVHDSDDWSHPMKLEVQATALKNNPHIVSTASLWARVSNDLTFSRRGNPGYFIQLNLSSIMFRKDIVLRRLGYFDSVRFGGDAEFNKRLLAVFGQSGKKTINKLLSFGRLHDDSLTKDTRTGYLGFASGARKLYKDIYINQLKTCGASRYSFPMDQRPFYAPAIMRVPGNTQKQIYDIAYIGDFSCESHALLLCALTKRASQWTSKIAIVQLYDPEELSSCELHPLVMECLNSGAVDCIVHGEYLYSRVSVVLDLKLVDMLHDFKPAIKSITTLFISSDSDHCLLRPTNTEDTFIRQKMFAVEPWIGKKHFLGSLSCYYDPIDIVFLEKLDQYNYRGGDVAVVMPCIDLEMGITAAKSLYSRAGMHAKIVIGIDTHRKGFIASLNSLACRINASYIVYVAQDVLPGRSWLKIAYSTMESTGKGMLGFNDGKWDGSIASYGMIRLNWVKSIYGNCVFWPGYKSHVADKELTHIAMKENQFVYEPRAMIAEYDPENLKDLHGSNPRDAAIYIQRVRCDFDLGDGTTSAIKNS